MNQKATYIVTPPEMRVREPHRARAQAFVLSVICKASSMCCCPTAEEGCCHRECANIRSKSSSLHVPVADADTATNYLHISTRPFALC